MDHAKFVTELKEAFGVKTDDELAEKIGITRTTIYTWRHGIFKPSRHIKQIIDMKLAAKKKRDALKKKIL